MLGLAIAAATLTREPLWQDELQTVGFADLSAGDWANAASHRTNGLLYDAVLWPVIRVFGADPLGVRLLSLVAFLGSIAMIGVVGRRLVDRRVGAIAALLLAVHPFAVEYAQEARPYALGLLASLVSAYVLLRAIERPTLGWWVLYTGTLLACGLTHYFALLVALAHPVLVWTRGGASARRWFVAAVGIPAVAGGAIASSVATELGTGVFYWVPAPSPGLVKDVVLALSGGWAGLGLGLAAAGPALALWRRRGSTERRGTVAFLFAWLAAPPVVLLLASLAQPLFVPRYALTSLPAACLLLAVVIARLPWHRFVPVAVAAVVVALAAASIDDGVRLSKTDWPGAAAYLEAASSPGDRIVVLGDVAPVVNGLLYYAPEPERDRRRLIWNRFDVDELPPSLIWADSLLGVPQLVAAVETPGPIWLVWSSYMSPAALTRTLQLIVRCGRDERIALRRIVLIHLPDCSRAR